MGDAAPPLLDSLRHALADAAEAAERDNDAAARALSARLLDELWAPIGRRVDTNRPPPPLLNNEKEFTDVAEFEDERLKMRDDYLRRVCDGGVVLTPQMPRAAFRAEAVAEFMERALARSAAAFAAASEAAAAASRAALAADVEAAKMDALTLRLVGGRGTS